MNQLAGRWEYMGRSTLTRWRSGISLVPVPTHSFRYTFALMLTSAGAAAYLVIASWRPFLAWTAGIHDPHWERVPIHMAAFVGAQCVAFFQMAVAVNRERQRGAFFHGTSHEDRSEVQVLLGEPEKYASRPEARGAGGPVFKSLVLLSSAALSLIKTAVMYAGPLLPNRLVDYTGRLLNFIRVVSSKEANALRTFDTKRLSCSSKREKINKKSIMTR